MTHVIPALILALCASALVGISGYCSESGRRGWSALAILLAIPCFMMALWVLTRGFPW